MTGQCLDMCFDQAVGTCQQQLCRGNGTALEMTQECASFFNVEDHGDVLTIPHEYYRDIQALATDGAHGTTILANMIEAGRRVFISLGRPSPEFQCIHLPSHISVKWLHLHTFIGSVPKEGLPGTAASTTCGFGNQTVSEAVEQILSHIS
eukprot:CAMPEP_0169063130 /NCGR_PEP_ID=MMETSP1015-20121227/1105_1 /TAXON_ID=342587 /ORGANISM="Karlodinium micrum, Strain CCMP2283" /LENGTH=149 /DNA_ID=CAMNT_0009121415 /DNA_START=284 /DNA_END=733 /DNA_ORIENTATION=+